MWSIWRGHQLIISHGAVTALSRRCDGNCDAPAEPSDYNARNLSTLREWQRSALTFSIRGERTGKRWSFEDFARNRLVLRY